MEKIVEIVGQILRQLGANETVFVQLGLFVVCIGFLTVFVYAPYFKASDERNKRTKGADAVAKDALIEAKNLQAVYQTKAREINEKIKTIFENKKNEANKKAGDIISKAKSESETKTNQARTEIENQVKSAETQVSAISKEIASSLNQRFEKGL